MGAVLLGTKFIMDNISLWATVFGAFASLLGMIVSLRQARSARRASAEARAAMEKLRSAVVFERLKTAQNHIRAIAPDRVELRGVRLETVFDELRKEFDDTLSSLPTTGPESDARKMLEKAQVSFNDYKRSLKNEVDQEAWQQLQTYVQDAMSKLSLKDMRLD